MYINKKTQDYLKSLNGGDTPQFRFALKRLKKELSTYPDWYFGYTPIKPNEIMVDDANGYTHIFEIQADGSLKEMSDYYDKLHEDNEIANEEALR